MDSWSNSVPPLGPDACLSDRCAVCTYWHLKARHAAGENLSAYERDLVGLYEPRRSNGGWQNAATNLEIIYHDDRDDFSSEDSAMLAALMAIDGAERPLEFLV